MGHSIAVSGRLSFPASRAAALRALTIDCASFEDWPSSHELFEAGPGEPRSVEAVVEAFRGGELTEVEWSDDSLHIAGIIGADDAAWIYGGRDILALFRAAGSVGASGGLGMTGWLDGGPMEVVSITTKANGENNLSIMRGSQAENAAQAIHEKVEHLAEAITKPAAPTPNAGPAVMPLAAAELAHHASVVDALAKHDAKQLFELARALDTPEDTERFVLGANPFKAEPLTSVLRDASSLMAALRNGWPKLKENDARRLAKRALELYARLDREGARTLAQRAIDANLQGPVRAQAELLTVKSTDANAGLAALRRVLASNPPERTADLMDHPLIEKISKQPAARTVVLRELAALVGGPFDGSKQWKPYTREQARYAAALSFVLEAVLEPNDDMLEALLSLWTTHPSGDLAFHDLALEHGAPARNLFLSFFANPTIEVAQGIPLHQQAATVALAHDEPEALAKMRKLLQAKPLHPGTETVVRGLLAMIEVGKLPSPSWRSVVLEIARLYEGAYWVFMAPLLAARWKDTSGDARALALQGVRDAVINDAACQAVERLRDPTMLPELREILSGMSAGGASASFSRDRLAKTIAQLERLEKKRAGTAAPARAAGKRPEPKPMPEPKKAAAKRKPAPKKAAPKKGAPKKAAPKKAAPKKAAPKKAAPKKAAPKKKAALKKSAPKKAAPKKAVAKKKPAPKKTTKRR